MLKIILKMKDFDGLVKEYHLGDEFPPHNLGPLDKVDISASGHELQEIYKQIIGIPVSEGSVVRWSGDFGRFIYDNLKLK